MALLDVARHFTDVCETLEKCLLVVHGRETGTEKTQQLIGRGDVEVRIVTIGRIEIWRNFLGP
jgi:hypothetical protein